MKVIYLAAPGNELSKARRAEPLTLTSYAHPQGDVILEATRRGKILAVVRMGNIDLATHEASKEESAALERAGKLVEITLGNDGRLGRLKRSADVESADRHTLRVQLDRLMVELQKAHSQNDALRKRLKDESARARNDVLLSQVEHWLLNAARAQLKNESLKKELDEARAEIRSLQSALAEREKELRRLKKGKK